MSETENSPDRHIQLARLVVKDGKPFRVAAVEAGFSASYGHMGIKRMRESSQVLDSAFKRAESEIQYRPDALKVMAINRIARTCQDDRNSDNLKAAELIGKFKSVDLFVRNGEAQVGIFFGAVEARDDEFNALDVPATEPDDSNSP